jgi:hypothetical protein
MREGLMKPNGFYWQMYNASQVWKKNENDWKGNEWTLEDLKEELQLDFTIRITIGKLSLLYPA